MRNVSGHNSETGKESKGTGETRKRRKERRERRDKEGRNGRRTIVEKERETWGKYDEKK